MIEGEELRKVFQYLLTHDVPGGGLLFATPEQGGHAAWNEVFLEDVMDAYDRAVAQVADNEQEKT